MLSLNRPELLKDKCLINGEWRDATSGKTDEVINPATGEVITTVPYMGVEEAQEAIDSAETAFKSWRNYMCPNSRSVCVLNIHISL